LLRIVCTADKGKKIILLKARQRNTILHMDQFFIQIFSYLIFTNPQCLAFLFASLPLYSSAPSYFHLAHSRSYRALLVYTTQAIIPHNEYARGTISFVATLEICSLMTVSQPCCNAIVSLLIITVIVERAFSQLQVRIFRAA